MSLHQSSPFFPSSSPSSSPLHHPPPTRSGNARTRNRNSSFRSVQKLDPFGRRGDMFTTIQQRYFSSFFEGFVFCFLQEIIVGSSGMGRGVHFFDVVHPTFSLQTTTSSTLQGALKIGFGEGVVACHMPEPCKFRNRNKVKLSKAQAAMTKETKQKVKPVGYANK